MEKELEQALQTIHRVRKEAEVYQHACALIDFDRETICPPKALEEQGEVSAFLANKAFVLFQQEEYQRAGEVLYQHREELCDYDRALAEELHEEFNRTHNITPEMDLEFAKIYSKAYIDWLEAKRKQDFSLFAPSLKEIIRIEKKQVELMDEKSPVFYDNFLARYTRDETVEDLDRIFGRCKERLVPLLKKIMQSKHVIRRDFLTRLVSDEAQRQMAQYLLQTIGFDFERGTFSTTEHPFTSSMGRYDERLTTHYRDSFISSIYSIVHEGGHALFDQFQPQENWDHFITDRKTMGQHESVSRFYENRIGRSESFIHLIYPKVCEIFPEAMHDVSEREFYEAVNIAEPSMIRTEADELTYTFHIIIRYEMEKAILEEGVPVEELPKLWNDKYEEYLGIRPANDEEGILQDMHWTFGFGYFPTYALGNLYNAMYINRMKKELDFDGEIAAGNMKSIRDWMEENVWKKADRLAPREWIRDITGRDFTPDDFLDYLEEKYTKLYEL